MFEKRTDSLDLYKQGNGSKLFCLRDMEPKAAALQEPTLEERIEASITQCLVVQKLNYDWAQFRRSGPASRQKATETDVRVDRTVGQIFRIATNFADGELDSPHKEAGTRLVRELFPNGVFPITSLQYEEQYPAVRELCRRLAADYVAEYELLGLTPVVESLVELNELFGAQLSVHDGHLTFNKVRAARQKADEEYAKVIICALNATLDDLSARKHLLSAVEDQLQRIGRYMRRRGNAPVIDPDTGDIVDDEDLEPAGDIEPITGDVEPAPAPAPTPEPVSDPISD